MKFTNSDFVLKILEQRIMKKNLRLSLVLFLAVLYLPNLTLAQNDKKAAYGILLDNTGSMRSQIQTLQNLSKAVAQNATKRGIVSIFNFETQGDFSDKKSFLAVATSGTDWSQDKNAIGKYIDVVKIAGGQTTLLDAIHSIGKITDEKANAEKLSEKIIILITDGEDRASKIKEKQVIKELKEKAVKVYAIGIIEDLGDEGGFIGKNPQDKAKSFLKEIAKETGGNAIFPTMKKAIKIEDLLTELFAESNKK
jgi:Ca-activated chloride channel family protein